MLLRLNEDFFVLAVDLDIGARSGRRNNRRSSTCHSALPSLSILTQVEVVDDAKLAVVV